MQDDTLYNMTDNTEYQANLFAADLLIEDEEIEDMVQNRGPGLFRTLQFIECDSGTNEL